MLVHQKTIDSPDANIAPFPHNDGSHLLLVFAPTEFLKSSRFLENLKAACPAGTQMAACSTAGEIDHEGVQDGVAVATLCCFKTTEVKVASVAAQVDDAKKQIGTQPVGRKLSDAIKAEISDPSYVFFLSDGLHVDGSEFVRNVHESFHTHCGFSGGMAADGGRFVETIVVENFTVRPHSVVAIIFKGENLKIQSAAASGWVPFGTYRQITRADGNCLLELDSTPALDVYASYLGDLAKDLPASGLVYPLEITEPGSSSSVIRTLLAIDKDAKSIYFAGDTPVGSSARLMSASNSQLVDGAQKAAAMAHAELPSPSLAILVSCMGRKLAMNAYTDLEVEAVKQVLPPATPTCGFYSYGEIAPSETTDEYALHNQTMTITLITESP